VRDHPASADLRHLVLWTQLRMSYERLRGEARGGNQPNLNLQIVRSFTVLNPPLIDRRRLIATSSDTRRCSPLRPQPTAADDMFNSLVQRTFRGEL